MSEQESDPFHDFSVPQDADLVASPTPNSADDEASGSDDGKEALDDDPLGADD